MTSLPAKLASPEHIIETIVEQNWDSATFMHFLDLLLNYKLNLVLKDVDDKSVELKLLNQYIDNEKTVHEVLTRAYNSVFVKEAEQVAKSSR